MGVQFLEDQASLEALSSEDRPLVVGNLGILYFRSFPSCLDLWCLQKASGVRTWWPSLAQLLLLHQLGGGFSFSSCHDTSVPCEHQGTFPASSVSVVRKGLGMLMLISVLVLTCSRNQRCPAGSTNPLSGNEDPTVHPFKVLVVASQEPEEPQEPVLTHTLGITW